MSSKKKKKSSKPPKPVELSDAAKERLQEGEQMFRLMGVDEQTIQAMKAAMEGLYNPQTGDFDLDDFESFKDAMLPALVDSPVMEETLAATDLLDHPHFRSFWFTAEQMEECLTACDHWLQTSQEEHGETFQSAAVLLDESLVDERRDFGRILYRHFTTLATPEFGSRIYDALFEFSQTGTEQEKALAKNAMVTFNLFPGNSNAFLQYLFVKSLVEHLDLKEELMEIFTDEETRAGFVETMADALFAILCEGEDSLWDEA